jgi:membrane associated rhomboid family serine protease
MQYSARIYAKLTTRAANGGILRRFAHSASQSPGAPRRPMFVAIPSRSKSRWRWATPLLAACLVAAWAWSLGLDRDAHGTLLLEWGALSGALLSDSTLREALADGSAARLVTALLLHVDLAHLLGNVVFLLIFGWPAERMMGPWRLLLLFLAGGAVANLAAVVSVQSPDRIIIGASGAISALMGAYLALFPGARLGVVVPLGLFLQFVRAPASLLIGIWALLQLVFTFFGPSLGAVAWAAHLGGFAFGVLFALVARRGITRRMRGQRQDG